MKTLNAYELMGMIKAKQLQKQKGASMIEYAILVGVIVAIGVAVMNADIGKDIADHIKKAVESMPTEAK